MVGGNESRTQEEDESMDEDCRRGSVAARAVKGLLCKDANKRAIVFNPEM